MVKKWVMNQDDFYRFLAWLDSDRDEAGKRYEKIRAWLIRIGRARGKTEAQAEEIADEVINRVVRKLPGIIDDYVGLPERYIYGVLRKILIEPDPPPPVPPPAPPTDELDDKEWRDACLQHCLKKLSPEDQKLLLDYYADDGRAKIEHRRELAERLGISTNALRIHLCRLRATLKECLDDCLKKKK
jgi:DNA-directed RNA polymerase specialized sigma24 family protein